MKYSWKPQLPDIRDYQFSQTIAVLPTSVDLRPKMPPVYDQGQLGSCTANAIAGSFEFAIDKELKPDFVPSRLFIYYNERVIEGTVKTDSGANIRDGIKSANTQGVCPETEWPYTISKFKTKPTAKSYKDALKTVVKTYSAVNQDLNSMKTCLALGYPFVFGFSVYTSFESASVESTGIVNLPTKTEKLLGGHAVVAVGYDDSTQRFIVRNSWGSSWGQAGYFTIPYTYLTNSNLASDFWQIDLI